MTGLRNGSKRLKSDVLGLYVGKKTQGSLLALGLDHELEEQKQALGREILHVASHLIIRNVIRKRVTSLRPHGVEEVE